MSETIRRIRPTPTDRYLGNPHKGCCTFQKFNGEQLFPGITWSEEGPVVFSDGSSEVVDGYLPSTVSYCRWFWKILEPAQGNYDFSVIDQSLEACRKRGQTLAVRLMAFGSGRQPQVPDWFAKLAPQATWINDNGAPQVVPVHDSPLYLEHWGNLIKEFASRYDSHPLLETIDIAYVGPWGEGAGDISPEQAGRFAELFASAFTKTPRMSLMTDVQLQAALKTGAGWRCDCFGDLGRGGNAEVPPHLAWNHTFDVYPQALVTNNAQEVWRTAPIHLETCYVPMGWFRWNYDLDLIIQQGLKYHATYFMPKSTYIPAEWRARLGELSQKLGYRYILRQAVVDTAISHSEKFRFRSWIENVGVAPIYHRYDFALCFRQNDRQHIIVLDEVNILKWLPGDAYIDAAVTLPSALKPGPVDLSVGLLDPITKEPRIRFAVKEAFTDRWVPLTTLYLT